MAETLRCPFCGGLNPADAQWCGQCLKPFPVASQEEPASAEPTPAPPLEVAPPPLGEAHAVTLAVESAGAPAVVTPNPTDDGRAFSVSAEGITWKCPTCETANPIESDVCSVCGTTFRQMVHPEPEREDKDPNTAALVSLFFPGAGHAYLGMWSEAIARGVISLWAVGVALIAGFAGEQASGRLITILFGITAFALWGVAAHDAYRSARHEKDRVILKGRGFLLLVLGLLGLLLMIVVGSALNVN